jgi:large subunit ribosomal protein L25
VSELKLDAGIKVVLHGKKDPVIATVVAQEEEAPAEAEAAAAAAPAAAPAPAAKAKPKK